MTLLAMMGGGGGCDDHDPDPDYGHDDCGHGQYAC